MMMSLSEFLLRILPQKPLHSKARWFIQQCKGQLMWLSSRFCTRIEDVVVEKDYRIVFWYKMYKFVQEILSYLYSIFIITPREN